MSEINDQDEGELPTLIDISKQSRVYSASGPLILSAEALATLSLGLE
jgi:hypothetical protein